MSSYIKNFGVLGDIFEKKTYIEMKPPVPSAQETHDIDNDASGMLKRTTERKMGPHGHYQSEQACTLPGYD